MKYDLKVECHKMYTGNSTAAASNAMVINMWLHINMKSTMEEVKF